MKSIINHSLKVTLTLLFSTFIVTAILAETKHKEGKSDAAESMKVNIASGKGNYNLKLHKSKKANNVYLSIYDSNNTKVVNERLKPGRLFKKKYKLSQFNSESFYFVIENGSNVHVEEVM